MRDEREREREMYKLSASVFQAAVISGAPKRVKVVWTSSVPAQTEIIALFTRVLCRTVHTASMHA